MSEPAQSKWLRRISILSNTLNENDKNAAAAVLKSLPQPEIVRITTNMLKTGQVTHQEMEEALEEFMDTAERIAASGLDSSASVHAMLVEAIGQKRADDVMSGIVEDSQAMSGIQKLDMMEPSQTADLIKDESEQVIATIFSQMSPKVAGQVLMLLPEEKWAEILQRMAGHNGVQPTAQAQMMHVINTLLTGQTIKRSKLGGTRSAAEVLNTIQSAAQVKILDAIRETNAITAEQIEEEMFLFENIIDLEDRVVQRIITEINSNSLVVALKSATDELKDKFLRNMSERAGAMLVDEMDQTGPKRVSEVEAEQKEILDTIRRLAAAGEISLATGDDQYV